MSFKNRVFGCAIIKAMNANYNADFTHQPRTLPDGTVYATDKALKYTIRNYILKNYSNEKIFFFKSYNETLQPNDLDGRYTSLFGQYIKPKGKDKSADYELLSETIKNLMNCIDVKLFGSTYASQIKLPSDNNKKLNFSIHGTVQFTHGVNRYTENVIYSEQISSPFRNSSEKSTESMQTTLGTQFKLQEGHYVHHLSINPRNLEEMNKIADNKGLSNEDISKLKEALRNGATFYDSAAKAGVENELLLWVQLKEGSKLVLPSFVELISINKNKEIDLSAVTTLLNKTNVKPEIESIEIYYNKDVTKVINAPAEAQQHELN